MLRLIDDLPEGTVGVAASGVVTVADLVAGLAPVLTAVAGPVPLLLQVADTTDTAVPGASAPRRVPRLARVGSCAVLAAPDTHATARRIASSLRPVRVRVFAPEERAAALTWLTGGSAGPVRETALLRA